MTGRILMDSCPTLSETGAHSMSWRRIVVSRKRLHLRGCER
jgi:hypothetical protein